MFLAPKVHSVGPSANIGTPVAPRNNFPDSPTFVNDNQRTAWMVGSGFGQAVSSGDGYAFSLSFKPRKDDLMICLVSGSNANITWPDNVTGWTQLYSSGGTLYRVKCATRSCGDDDPLDYNVPPVFGAHSNMTLIVVRKWIQFVGGSSIFTGTTGSGPSGGLNSESKFLAFSHWKGASSGTGWYLDDDNFDSLGGGLHTYYGKSKITPTYRYQKVSAYTSTYSGAASVNFAIGMILIN
jgi:hypothetical protein